MHTTNVREIVSQRRLLIVVVDFNKMSMHWTTGMPCGRPVLVARYQLVSLLQARYIEAAVSYNIDAMSQLLNKRQKKKKKYIQNIVLQLEGRVMF